MTYVDETMELRIAGTGPHEPELRELAAGDARIVFLGPVTEDELVRSYADARAVLFVPYSEDYGYITVEAMLSAKPVVTATDSGGPTELVEHGVNGLICAPDPQALGEAMTVFARHPRVARRMGRAGHARAAQISWDRVVSALLDGLG
jgi:glycosyltransferase involved in cell wall biosynthesis